MARRVEKFDVKPGTPPTIEFELDGIRYRANVVVAVHGVVDQGADAPGAKENPGARFQYRVSLAVDTQPELVWVCGARAASALPSPAFLHPVDQIYGLLALESRTNDLINDMRGPPS